MLAGKLDRRITLERATVTQDAYGADTPTWAPLTTVWASKEDIRDSERFRAGEVGADITTRFQVRWSSQVKDIGPEDRLTHEGRVYSIAAVKEIGRREGLEITASARAETP